MTSLDTFLTAAQAYSDLGSSVQQQLNVIAEAGDPREIADLERRGEISSTGAAMARDYLRQHAADIIDTNGAEAEQLAGDIDDYLRDHDELMAAVNAQAERDADLELAANDLDEPLDERANSTEADELTPHQRRLVAIAYLRRLAAGATDPGDRGYSLGIIDRIQGGENVTPAYLEQLRAGLERQHAERQAAA